MNTPKSKVTGVAQATVTTTEESDDKTVNEEQTQQPTIQLFDQVQAQADFDAALAELSALAEAARVFQGRGRTSRLMERTGYPCQVVAGARREGVRPGAVGRNANDHRRRKK